MAAKIDQKEYLKRYLSNDKDKKKKKKKKDKTSAVKKSNVVIVDDDLDLSQLQSRIDDNETDLFGLDEEAPQVVGIIDERPPELRAKEDFGSSKWKAINTNDSFDSMLRANESNRLEDVVKGDKSERRRKYDSDESPARHGKNSSDTRGRKDSDESPPRRRRSPSPAEKDISRGRKKRDDSDESPPRKSSRKKGEKSRDSDESPPRRKSFKEKDVSGRSRRNDDSDESPPRRRRSKEKETSRAKARREESDESPPRRRRSKEKNGSRSKGRKDDSDESHPRRPLGTEKRKERYDSDAGPPRKHRHHDSDESPPRRRKEKSPERDKKRHDSDASPPRRDAKTCERNRSDRKGQYSKSRHQRSDSDESPPRQRKDYSPERRKKRHDTDESPPRRDANTCEKDRTDGKEQYSKSRHQRNDSDESPPRKKSSNRRYDSDASPPRRNRPSESDGRSRMVPEKMERSRKSSSERAGRRRNDSDESPPRRRRNDNGESSARRSPERRQQSTHGRSVSPSVRIKQERRSSDSDLSPPRKTGRSRDPPQVEQRIKREPRSPSTSSKSAPREKMTKTLDGKRAGLQDAKSLREENEKHRAREKEALMKLSDDVSGRFAETVVREKGGRRRDVEKELREELAKRKHEEKKKEIYSRWGKGVKQVEDYKAQLEEAAREMEKPLARYADDKDLDERDAKTCERNRSDRKGQYSKSRHQRSDSDESPPRQRKDYSPERRKKRHDTDESPPRRDANTCEKDRTDGKEQYSKSRHQRNDSDESPPRKKSSNRRYDSDASPPRRNRPSESDGRSRMVPEKMERSRKSSSERAGRRRNDSDESPPRRRRNDNGESSARRSPERRQQSTHGRSVSPSVRIKQERRSSDSDLSPPRKTGRSRDPPQVEQRIKREPRSPSTSSKSAPREKMTKTLDGKRAGLQDAKSLREENEKHRAREKEALMKLSDDVSGRFAETVVREKGGRRRDVEKELREELAKRKHEEKKKEIYSRWGKGVKQVEDYKAQLEEAAREMEKPLARYADDKDLDEYLKQQEREGDPMLEYLRSKRKEENKRAGIPEKPVYQGAFPDNRYGIRPGYRWDGVDRSNGFEKRWFETMSKKKAIEEEAYKYSVEDM
uniref:BUD13 homolog n=1 Tax=Anopheles epiroticus TaxID=199890 RepID=A0A182P349_9DIPT